MDTTELKLLAEAAMPAKWASYQNDRDFAEVATPTAILALIAHIAELEAITGPGLGEVPANAQKWANLSAESACVLIERQANDVWEAGQMMTAWADARVAKMAAAAAPDLHAAILALPCAEPDRGHGKIYRGGYVQGFEDARRAAAALAAAVSAVAELGPEFEVDPMEIVRSLVRMVDILAKVPENKRAAYQSPTADDSPLMIAARNACVERGFTRGGLAIETGTEGGPA